MAHRGKLTYFCYKKYCQIIILVWSWLVCCVVYIKKGLMEQTDSTVLMDHSDTSVLVQTFRHRWWIWYYICPGQIHSIWLHLPRNVKHKKILKYECKMIKYAYATSLCEELQVYMPSPYFSCSLIQFQMC